MLAIYKEPIDNINKERTLPKHYFDIWPQRSLTSAEFQTHEVDLGPGLRIYCLVCNSDTSLKACHSSHWQAQLSPSQIDHATEADENASATELNHLRYLQALSQKKRKEKTLWFIWGHLEPRTMNFKVAHLQRFYCIWQIEREYPISSMHQFVWCFFSRQAMNTWVIVGKQYTALLWAGII